MTLSVINFISNNLIRVKNSRQMRSFRDNCEKQNNSRKIHNTILGSTSSADFTKMSEHIKIIYMTFFVLNFIDNKLV